MKQIPCDIIRGGTSKGIYIDREALPSEKDQFDREILSLFGSPDTRQIDGLGGADKLTSKVAVMGAPTKADCDIDYLFGQVNITLPFIDWKSNCGNISAGAALYAVLKKYVATEGEAAKVRIHQVNTGRTLIATVPVENSQPKVDGDYSIGGVPGTAARLDLDFSDFSGCILGRGILPTGSPCDTYDVPNLGKIDASIVDLANLCIFIRASDVGMDDSIDIVTLQENRALVKELETIRTSIAVSLGYIDATLDSDEFRIKMNPLLFIVGAPRDYATLNGDDIPADGYDLFSRSITRGLFSKAYPGTGSVATAAACCLPGTIASEFMTSEKAGLGETYQIRIGHPSGTMSLETLISSEGVVQKILLGRTARLLMSGNAFIR